MNIQRYGGNSICMDTVKTRIGNATITGARTTSTLCLVLYVVSIWTAGKNMTSPLIPFVFMRMMSAGNLMRITTITPNKLLKNLQRIQAVEKDGVNSTSMDTAKREIGNAGITGARTTLTSYLVQTIM